MSVRHSRTLRTALVGAAAAGALLLSACGSDKAADSNAAAVAALGSASAAVSTAAVEASAAVSSGMAEASSGMAEASSMASAATEPAATESASTGAAGTVDVAAAVATLIEPGKLTICTHLSYAPFQFDDGTGKIVGFDVDIMDAVAAKLGVEQTIVDTPFEGIKGGVDTASGKCDASAAAMSITPEREKVILFSEPYFDATQALLIRDGDSYTDLASLSGKKIGGQAGTVGLDYLNENAAANGYEVVEYSDLPSQGTALLTNQIDAAVNDAPVWKDLVDKNPGKLKVAAAFDTGDQYGIGMKLGNDALKAVIDSTLEELKADGEYNTIYEKWIGEIPAG